MTCCWGRTYTHTADEEWCETHMRRRYGRFVLRLQFTDHHEQQTGLGRSKSIAISRLLQSEKRFKKNPNAAETYKKCLQENITPVDDHSTQPAQQFDRHNARQCYLPNHAVIKESSTTTKVRVVFDASKPTSSGKSLNECMLIGPRLQQDLFDIIL